MPNPGCATDPRSITLLVVDDHELVREAMVGALERQADLRVVAEAGSIRELGDLRIPEPDVAIVDYSLPDGTGADLCRELHARWPKTHIVGLSAETAEATIISMLRAGADGFVAKAERLTAIVRAIHEVHEGRPVVPPSLLGEIARGIGGASAEEVPDGDAHATVARREPVLRERLTPRELGVLRLLANGRSTHDIARDLGMAEGTVRRHVEAIRRKFGVHSRLEAVSEAIRAHIVELPAN